MGKVWLAVLSLVLTVNVFGQLKAITGAEYESALSTARSKAEKILRREVSETSNYQGSKVISTRSLIIETFPNDDYRWNLVDRKDGKITYTLQLIVLGKYEYRKEGESNWNKRCVRDCSESESSGGMAMRGTELPKLEEFLMTNTPLEGQPSKVYIHYRVYKLQAYLDFYERKIWIGTNGLILMEQSTTSDIFPDVLRTVETKKYEYDPKNVLPIEAPIK